MHETDAANQFEQLISYFTSLNRIKEPAQHICRKLFCLLDHSRAGPLFISIHSADANPIYGLKVNAK